MVGIHRTSFPSIHWIVPIAAGVPFGLGMLVSVFCLLSFALDTSGDCCKLVFTSVVSYIMDTYRHLCASAIASIVVLRCILAAVFPLFTDKMFQSLGDQWGLTVFAILSLVCVPLPFLFYASRSSLFVILVFNDSLQVFGKRIRAASHFASEFEKQDTA